MENAKYCFCRFFPLVFSPSQTSPAVTLVRNFKSVCGVESYNAQMEATDHYFLLANPKKQLSFYVGRVIMPSMVVLTSSSK